MKSRVAVEAGRAFLTALDSVVAAIQPSPEVQLRLQVGLRRREIVDTAVHCFGLASQGLHSTRTFNIKSLLLAHDAFKARADRQCGRPPFYYLKKSICRHTVLPSVCPVLVVDLRDRRLRRS